jgi:GDPmannose 4,6-dehydratase
MLQLDDPVDLVVATGISTSLESFVERAFAVLGLSWRDHVDTDQHLFRPSDISASMADPEMAAQVLHWKAETKGGEVVEKLVEAELSGWFPTGY